MTKIFIIVTFVVAALISGYCYSARQHRNRNYVDALRVEANAVCRAYGENHKGCRVMRDWVHARELQYGIK